ncbi:DUF262 domain-containing protein [Alkalicoccobacillus murimartini]|uniref:GmrSD restriction endonucleases N-terminal domain-containing protein n=1 Tax=Alkalicoccobacillus murimartini TaxID=171685 RepID=A0ABT9YNH3_9BACI|nr:DUF262 domain-containing protein [Alkalicoccobacillus murimartini]MDQ0209040.1 hypothetical protein [Alkalicoccobacillus murimartini]
MSYKNDPKPEVLRIEELVINVKSGDIKLPKFQRPFVWKKENILALLDSIYNRYPIGSILLWLTKEKLASERRIGDLEINERPEEYPTNYLLDGQQRLSTLCGALYWDGVNQKSMWNISFDLDKETFLYPDGEDKFEYFPLNKLLGTFDFINQLKKFEGHDKKEKYEKNAGRLLEAIKNYKVAAVIIGNMSVNEVAPIFERINSTGRRLTMVDLMRAATWSGEFDLSNSIDTIRESLSTKNFEGVPEIEILRNISTVNGYGMNRDDINKLRNLDSKTLEESSKMCKLAYERAVDFMTRELPITSSVYLPYSLQLTFLVEFFNVCPNPTIMQREELKKWFWKVALSKYFASFNTAQITLDLKNIRDFGLNKINQLTITKPVDYKNFSSENFRLNKASSKTFGLLLAHNQPLSLLDGSRINTNKALAVVNRHEYHHIFPKAFLKSSGIKEMDTHANICLLNMGNNRTISDSRPSIYLKNLRGILGNKFTEVLDSNFINEEAYNAAISEDYNEFIKIRKQLLITKAKGLVGDRV